MEVQVTSKKIAKVFGLSYVSKPKALRILRMLSEGEPQSDISKKAHIPKSVVNYWAQKFCCDKLIMEIGKGKPQLFKLTAFGARILTTCERGMREPCIMEDYPRALNTQKSHSQKYTLCRWGSGCLKPH